MAEAKRFELVQDDDPAPRDEPADAGRSADLLLLSLQALSKRTIVALGNLYSMFMVGSAWFLFMRTLPSPTEYQLVGLFLYGLLIIAVHVIIRRER
jgi:hypothetical protein